LGKSVIHPLYHRAHFERAIVHLAAALASASHPARNRRNHSARMSNDFHVFIHFQSESGELTDISHNIKKLILMHGGEEHLKAVADKLNISTEALAAALQDAKAKE
jgi:hypothetical protein